MHENSVESIPVRGKRTKWAISTHRTPSSCSILTTINLILPRCLLRAAMDLTCGSSRALLLVLYISRHIFHCPTYVYVIQRYQLPFLFSNIFLLSFAHIAKFYYQQTSVGSTRDLHNKYLVVVTPFNDKVIYSIIDYREYTQWSLGWNAPKHCAYVIYFEYFFVNRIRRMKITSYVTHTIRLWDEMSELWRHWSFQKHDPFLLILILFKQN